ncbi:MAG: Wzz/FepE/Etk N-terminal domain-containing protein [Bacteroidales bacterium]|nr:Wzz/FepE/Etk N-terminal domain-containing protein [Bacteroidales bacterium]
MPTNNVNDEVEIDLQELFFFFFRKLWILILVAIIGGGIAFAYTKFLVTPMYQSNTSVYILNKRDDSSTVTTSDLSVSSQLTKDYAKLITSRRVLEGVVDTLGLSISADSLGGKISVSTITDTRIIQIKVKDANPNNARIIADEVRTQASEVIQSVMDIEAINVVDVASLPKSPVSPDLKKNVLLGAAAGFVIFAGIFVVQFLLDDTVKNADDVERYLQLSTLANIPVFGEDEKKKGKKKSSRKEDSVNKPASKKSEDELEIVSEKEDN